MAAEERDTVWYFAYGSNLDPERFVRRVGPWKDRAKAILPGWQLRFSGDVRSEGGGGAIIEPCVDARVYGAAYRILLSQLEEMDAVELGSDRNVHGKGVRHHVGLQCELASEAETYTVKENSSNLAPSDTYLNHILVGLRAVGWDSSVCQEVEARAQSEPGPGPE